MKTSIKTFQDINSFHDLRTYTGTVRKTAKPALPTTAILDLYMRRNERERIEKELKKIKKRKEQLAERLKYVQKDMKKLTEMAIQKAIEIRGDEKKFRLVGSAKKLGKAVLGY